MLTSQNIFASGQDERQIKDVRTPNHSTQDIYKTNSQGYQPNRICAAVKPGYAQKCHRENASARVNRDMRIILLEKTRICAAKPGYAHD